MIIGKKALLGIDNIDLSQVLTEQLELGGEFITTNVLSEMAAIKSTENNYYDIILLDTKLGDRDGREICKSMRVKDVKSPIIIFIDNNISLDSELSLECGANDFVVKPFHIGTLVNRIYAQVSIFEKSSSAAIQVGPYKFKPAEKLMLDIKKNKKIRLTDKETAIIKFLYLAKGEIVARDVLLGEVWGYSAGVTTHTLETHVYRLRQKIEPDPANLTLLLTEPKGYRLIF